MYVIDSVIHNYGMSLILFVLFTKVVLFPLAIKQQKSTAKMAAMSAKQKELQKKHGKDKTKLNEETMKLYEQEGVNPMGGCLPMVVQMVLLFGIIDVIYKPITHLLRIPADVIKKASDALLALTGKPTSLAEVEIIKQIQEGSTTYAGIFSPENLEKIQNFNMHFLGFNMGDVPTWNSILVLIPILSGLTALASTLISMKIQEKNGQAMQGAMKYTMMFMPLMSVWIGFSMPAGAGVYWTVSNIFMVIQTILVQKMWPPERVAAMSDKGSEKARAKMRKKRERMEEYNKMMEAKGLATKPIPKKLAEPKVIDKEALAREKEMTSRKLAEARKRMAEKYGEEYRED